VVSAIKASPAAQIPADQTSKSEVMQKKLIDCPISSHEPTQRVKNMKQTLQPVDLTGIGNIIKERQSHTWRHHKSEDCLIGEGIVTICECQRNEEEGEGRQMEASVKGCKYD